MAGANDLPQEIWELIVAYLPWCQTKRLIRLNRKLYEIVLDEKYRNVVWVPPDSDLWKTLKRLSDPAIASHVRRLYIGAGAFRELPPTPIEGMESPPIERVESPPNALRVKRESKLWKYLPRFIPRPSSNVQYDSNCATIYRRSSIFSSLSSRKSSAAAARENLAKEIPALMTKALNSMKNLKALVIEWRCLPPNVHPSTFLQILPSSSLCSLTLRGTLNKLQPLLTLLQTPQLEELSLEFGWEDITEGNDALAEENEAILVDVLVPYIRSLTSTLRSLQIISQCSGNHSVFFSALPYLPHLNELVLEIPFSKQRFASPQSLIDFLQPKASSLTHFELLIQREWDRDRELEMESNLVEFYRNLLQMDPWFSELRFFCITAPPRSCKDPLTQSLLNRLPPTVATLALAHRYYFPPELISMVFFVSSNVGAVRNITIDVAKVPPPNVLKEPSIKMHEVWTLTLDIGKDNNGSYPPLYWPYGHERPRSAMKWSFYDLRIYLTSLMDGSIASWFATRGIII